MYQSKETSGALEEIKATVEENKDFYDFAILRGVYLKTPEGWKNALTKIVLMKKGIQKEPEDKLEYDNIVFIKKVIKFEDFKVLIENLSSEKVLKFDEYPCVQTGYVDKRNYPSNDFFDWPGKLLTIECEKPNIPSNRPLLGYSKPLFLDAYHAIEKWMDFPVFHGSSDARLGAVLIFFPEYRARINSIKYNDGKLSVKADFNIPKFDDICCKAVIKTVTGEEFQESVNFEDEEVEFFIGSPPVNTCIYLITPKDKILDFYEETPFRHTGKKRLIANEEDNKDSDIRTLIMAGENDQIEFKETVKEDKTKKDLVRTAVAFANTKGGKIIIGVNDNAEIIGINNELMTMTLPKLKEKYDNILRDNAKKALKYSMEFREIGKTILIIQIEEGQSKPYSTKDNEIFIRIGATDRRPDPDTELKALFPSVKT